MEYPSPIEVGLRNQSFSLRGDLSATFGLGWMLLLLLVAGMVVVVMSSFNNEGEGGGSAATAAIAGSFYSSALCFK